MHWLIPTAACVAMFGIQSDEVVVFYNTCAHRVDEGKAWRLPIHGLVYEPEEDSVKRALLIAVVGRSLKVEEGTPQFENLNRRLHHFLVDNERSKQVAIRVGSRVHVMNKSGANGHFQGEVRLAASEARRLLAGQGAAGGWIAFQAVLGDGDPRRFVGRVQLIERHGLSLISDIDDTIKITQVADRRATLANTFLRDFRPVPGMAELYSDAARRGVACHYVSGSPWQLYLPLSDFLHSEGFPPGSFYLKYFRLKDSTALNVVTSQVKTKRRAIDTILAAFAQRHFILVGDSGEQDPEIYGAIAREHGSRIAAIFIRNVTDEAADSDRLRTAFQGLSNDRWKLFRESAELRPRMKELVKTHAARPG